MTRVKICYVMGLWRSGSTLLDIVLGNHPEVESVGELRNLPIIGWHGTGVCACGKPASECDFWLAVRARWIQENGADETGRLIFLQDRFERLRSIPRLAGSTILASAEFRQYGELLGSLIDAIQKVGGRQVIIDSTKYPMRAAALALIPTLDTRLIHLVRDGRAVIWSCLRKPNTDLDGNPIEQTRRQIVRTTSRQWLKVNLACDAVSRLLRVPTVRVRYEDLVTDPAPTLTEVGQLLDLEMGSLAERLVSGQEMSIGHPVAGNRLRMSGSLRLRPDLGWRDHLTPADCRHFWRLAGRTARRYGYTD